MKKTTPETYRDPAAGDPNDEADGLRVGDETDDAADVNGDDDDDERTTTTTTTTKTMSRSRRNSNFLCLLPAWRECCGSTRVIGEWRVLVAHSGSIYH